MDRRLFLKAAAASPLLAAPAIPKYKTVTRFRPAANPGMPGPYPGQVVRVHAEKSIDAATAQIDRALVKSMIDRGMRELTGASRVTDAFAKFIDAKDVVGIKINCSGAPAVRSNPEVVAGIVENLVDIGVQPANIWVYERYMDQVRSVGYERFLPAGVHVVAAESDDGTGVGYDPFTYVETSFFGEDDTRSNLTRIISEKLTKIINVPNLKEHQASGVTGCLKNIAYGSFSNVARSHQAEVTNTYSFIGTLAAVEPLRSRTVLAIMDGLRGVWHQGPFSRTERFRFFPKQLMFGTDPVAMDRILIDVIEEKRKSESAVSIFDRSRSTLGNNRDPNFNAFIREPGHVEYAAGLGLGTYDKSKINLRVFDL